jgi:hypothetical protein
MSQLYTQNELSNENNNYLLETYSPIKSPEEEENNKKNAFFCETFTTKEEKIFFNNVTENNTVQNTNSFLLNNYDLCYNNASLSSDYIKNLSSKKQAEYSESNNSEKKKKEIEQKHILNKISARKSRQKKKEYIKNLEEELFKLKNEKMSKNRKSSSIINEKDEKNTKFFNNIILLEKHGKEIKKEGQKKKSDLIKEYEALQKDILKEMLIRQINYFLPLKYQIYGDKYIKLIKICQDDSFSVIITKLDENLNKINNYKNNIKSVRIKFVSKFHQKYQRLKDYVQNYQQMFIETFN